MKTRLTALLSVFALLCALWVAAAQAQIPRTINYQGYLTTSSGAAVNGNVAMTLKLYNAANAVSELYTETHPSVTVSNGIFNVQIGSITTPLPLFTEPYFLGVTIGTDPEMTPRRPLSAAPYAVTAENIAPGGNLYLSNSTATSGIVFKNGERFMHNTAFAGNNTFLGLSAGAAAGASLTFGRNVGIGSEALKSIQGGANNVAVGDNAAPNLSMSVFDNIAVGSDALFASTGGSDNVAIGGEALWGALGSNNIGLGFRAGSDLLSGNNNIMIGNPGTSGDTGVIRIGNASQHSQTYLAGTLNAAAIATLGAITTSSTLTAAGISSNGNISLIGSTPTSGSIFKDGERFMHSYGGASNTFLGRQAGNFTITNSLNVGVGTLALSALTTGGGNTGVGANAAKSVQSGGSNVAVGYLALETNVSANDNTAIGTAALLEVTSSGNIGLGKNAGRNLTTGGDNIMIGNQGVAGESATIRLGTPGTHTQTFLAGTVNTAAISATGAITTGGAVGAVGGILSQQSVTVSASTAARSVTLPTAMGVNLGGAATPDRPLTIQADTTGGGTEWISFKDGTGATKWHVNHKAAGINFSETGIADGRLYLAAGGRVGIGTDTPTRAKLEINGGTFGIVPLSFGVYSSGAAFSGGVTAANLSLYASDSVVAEAFFAISDQRMKRVSGRSNAARDLVTLSAIEVTDYTHIDTPQRGDKAHKKVIAQQVETVFPQAVNKITDVVPDIYQRAAAKDGWIVLNTNLKKGDRVRLIGKATQGVHEVLEVAAGRFRTAFKADSDTIFVYGREVNDFRTVDYEAIAMLNVSATQELHRRLEAEATKVQAQALEIARLKQQLAQLSDLDAKVAQLMMQLNPPVAINASNAKP